MTQNAKINSQALNDYSWKTLQVFNGYRLCLVLVLAGLYLLGRTGLGTLSPSFFVGLLYVYALFSILCLLAAKYRLLGFMQQVTMAVIGDLLLLAAMNYSSYFLGSILGILMSAAIAGGSILTGGRISLILALSGALALFGERLLASLQSLPHESFTQAGLLSATFAATAILGHVLSRRIRLSEALAKQQELDIKRLQQLNNDIVQRMRSGVLVADDSGCIYLFNHAAQQLLGEEHVRSGVSLQTLSSALANIVEAWKQQEQAYVAFKNAEGRDLATQIVRLHEPMETYLLIFLDDVSRMAQRAQQMKLASLGRFTASVAHEIRNPLGAISHAAQLLEESKALMGDDKRLLRIIRENGERMNIIIKNVLQLSRRQQAEPMQFLLVPWLKKYIQHYCEQQRDDVIIHHETEQENMQVWMDPSQLQQVLTNLFDNGLRYSRHETGEAILWVKAALSQERGEAFIDIYDKGPGVDDANRYRLFEPFFTTNRAGTGLGLYIAREICEANKARLEYHPQERGSCFRIVFGQGDYLEAVEDIA